jgi:hypothetical protein
MHLFNTEHYAGPLLYFDLDCIIIQNIDWITELPSEKFWCLRDFKYLQSPSINVINSSVMWWDTRRFEFVWQQFNDRGVNRVVGQHHGDQDFLHTVIDYNDRRYFEDKFFQSYRWQVAEGGWDFKHRRPNFPGSGISVGQDCTMVVFHGNPKPHQINNELTVKFWK